MKQLFTDLGDRKLRFDGASVVSPEMVAKLFLLGLGPHEIRVEGDAWEIQQFNANVPLEEKLRPPDDPVKISLKWQLPSEYKNLDLDQYVVDKAVQHLEINSYTLDQERTAANRVEQELQEIKQRGMTEFFKTIIYVLDVFRKNGVVWGVGRGSSCASYILFVLGLHAVDCVKLDIPMTEFFHE